MGTLNPPFVPPPKSSISRKIAGASLIILALAFTCWCHSKRIAGIDKLAEIPSWSVDAARPDPSSSTGYGNGIRNIVFPESNIESARWIQQAQSALADGLSRSKRIERDAAPAGLESGYPWLYRTLLVRTAQAHQAITGQPPGQSVEQAALYIEPLLQIFTAVIVILIVAIEFGGTAVVFAAVGMTILFPYNAAYVAGLPERYGLALSSAFFILLPTTAALRRFAAARVAKSISSGGSETHRMIVRSLGVAVFYFVLSAIASIVGQAVDPAGLLSLHIGLAIAGLVLVLRKTQWTRFGVLLAIFHTGMAAWALRSGFDVFSQDLLASRLTAIDGGLAAPNLFSWIQRDGFSPRVMSTLFPLSLLAVIFYPVAMERRNKSASATRMVSWLILPVIMPCIISLAFAMFELRLWSVFEASMIVGLVVATGRTFSQSSENLRVAADVSSLHQGSSRVTRWLAFAALLLSLPGALLVLPRKTEVETEATISESDFRRLLSRDLGWWIRQRDPRAVVLAPPELTASLSFYGGIRGVGTLDIDNRDGLDAVIRICSATTAEEALHLVQAHGITHLVIPSWDDFLGTSVRLSSASTKRPFISQLQSWQLPNWLLPTVYFIPSMLGVRNTQVVVFEVVSDQDDAASTSGLAEYFLETGRAAAAAELQERLERFPVDPTALIALAEIKHAQRDDSALRLTLTTLSKVLSGDGGADVFADRHAVAAVLFAQAGNETSARIQASRAAKEMVEADLKSLPPRQLLRFLALLRRYGIQIADPKVMEHAWLFLPPASRAAIE